MTAASGKTVLILRNSAATGQWSMVNSAQYIARAIAPDAEVRVFEAPVALSALRLGRLRKYLIYFDIYLVAAVALGFMSRSADLAVAADHSYAPALWLVPRAKRTAFVHDTIAQLQARGQVSAAPPVGLPGRIYQRWILSALAKMPVLAVNTQIEAGVLRGLGVRSELIEVGQPAAEFRLARGEADSAPVISRPYLLNVGGDSWIKNKKYLVDIYRALHGRTGGACPDLVLAGKVGADTAAHIAASGLEGRIIHIDRPDDSALAGLLGGCAGLIMASHLEGFGVPPMEALMFRKPVFLSDNPVFRLIYGRVGVFFPLDSAEQAAERIAGALDAGEVPSEIERQAVLERYSEAAVGERTRLWVRACLTAQACA